MHTPLDVLFNLFLTEGRFDYVDEIECQNQIERFLMSKGLTFHREFILSEGEIADFYFPRSQLVLEVKACKSWSKRRVYRQCERYCSHPAVQGLLLATGKAQGLPRLILNTPVRVYQLGVGLL